MARLLDALVSARERVQRRAEARRASGRVEAARRVTDANLRRQRIEQATPANRREALASAAVQARGLAGDVRGAVGAGSSRPSRLRRVVNRLEAEAEALDEAGEKSSAVAKRAEAAATAGGVIPGATLDPTPENDVVRALAEGGLTAEERAEIEQDGPPLSEMERLVLGLGGREDAVDRDGRPLIEELLAGDVDPDDGDPLEFDDPLGVGI